LVGRHDDGPAPRVDLPGQVLGAGERVPEELHEHLDHVLERVILVVDQDHVVRRQAPGASLLLDLGLDDGAGLLVTQHGSGSWEALCPRVHPHYSNIGATPQTSTKTDFVKSETGRIMSEMSAGAALRQLKQAQACLKKARQLMAQVRQEPGLVPKVIDIGWA